MRPLYLCELVLDDSTDQSVLFFCVGRPNIDDLTVAGQLAKEIALGVPRDLLRTYRSIRNNVLSEVGNVPVLRFARCPRQILPTDLVRQMMIVFDVERLRGNDLMPIERIDADVN